MPENTRDPLKRAKLFHGCGKVRTLATKPADEAGQRGSDVDPIYFQHILFFSLWNDI